ncbi:hypothetical protein H480_39130 [Amycolatopsis vancoresmycina DSM 44592]|uniref:NACHT domain-containing protein n=1 Tax=Amycolatopsis vancoresmycina DSM 44592 TaxID=1292037 RepID=R1FUJ3_9PSEU|nr:hypothetical protein H480_39130 [Amycolatopsis vancoresmycina DSM 44592]
MLTGLVVVGAALAWWVWQVSVLEPGERSNASGYGQFVLAAIGLLVACAGPLKGAITAGVKVPQEADLDQLASVLQEEWTAAADERCLLIPAPLPIRWRRSTRAVTGPVAAAVGRPKSSVRFEPLPGLRAVTTARLREGTGHALHAVYGGLATGRVLILGEPGSGKSAAAILLLLEALRFREQASPGDRARIPVPMLFTLHEWDPSAETVVDWLSVKIARAYPQFRGRGGTDRVTKLLKSGCVSVFLDGLDEIADRLRPLALTALRHAPFRLVLLTRTEEAVTAAGAAHLVGAAALELLPVTPSDASAYLLQPVVHPPPEDWRKLTEHLVQAPDSPVAQVLVLPFMLSLLHDAYPEHGADRVDELLDTSRFRTVADVENRILDRAVIVAYTPQPGLPPPRYSLDTACRTLGYIARQLAEQRTRDLLWWQMATWTTWTRRTGIAALLAGAVVAGSLGLAGYPVVGGFAGIAVGAAFFAIGMVALGGIGGFMSHGPARPSWIQRPFGREVLRIRTLSRGIFGAVSGGSAAIVAGGLLGRLTIGPSAGLRFGLLIGLIGGLAVGLAFGLTQAPSLDKGSQSPPATYRLDRNTALFFIFVVWPGAGLVTGLVASLELGLGTGLVIGPALGILLAVSGTVTGAIGTNAFLSLNFSATELAATRNTPVRMMAFLEDARSRHILRTVGPAYQFRHAKLHDHLARSPAAG